MPRIMDSIHSLLICVLLCAGVNSQGPSIAGPLFTAFQSGDNLTISAAVVNPSGNTTSINVVFPGVHLPSSCGDRNALCDLTVSVVDDSTRVAVTAAVGNGAVIALFDQENNELIFVEQYFLSLPLTTCSLTTFVQDQLFLYGLCYKFTNESGLILMDQYRIELNFFFYMSFPSINRYAITTTAISPAIAASSLGIEVNNTQTIPPAIASSSLVSLVWYNITVAFVIFVVLVLVLSGIYLKRKNKNNETGFLLEVSKTTPPLLPLIHGQSLIQLASVLDVSVPHPDANTEPGNDFSQSTSQDEERMFASSVPHPPAEQTSMAPISQTVCKSDEDIDKTAVLTSRQTAADTEYCVSDTPIIVGIEDTPQGRSYQEIAVLADSGVEVFDGILSTIRSSYDSTDLCPNVPKSDFAALCLFTKEPSMLECIEPTDDHEQEEIENNPCVEITINM